MKQKQEIILQYSGSQPSEFWPKSNDIVYLRNIRIAKRFTSIDEALQFAAKRNAELKHAGYKHTLQVVTIPNQKLT